MVIGIISRLLFVGLVVLLFILFIDIDSGINLIVKGCWLVLLICIVICDFLLIGVILVIIGCIL